VRDLSALPRERSEGVQVCLVRHGDAAGGGADAERALSPEGEKEIHQLAQALGALAVKPDAILSSPLLRARQTAVILQRALSPEILLKSDELLVPGASTEQMIHRLREMPSDATVFLIGHLPHLGELLTLLVWGQPEREVPISKGGACCIEFEGAPRTGAGRLRWLLTNRIIKIIAAAKRA
jgi:phosphohistidine phosphatase